MAPQRKRLVQSLASIAVTILLQADDAIAPAVDCIVEHLCTLNCSESSCTASMCVPEPVHMRFTLQASGVTSYPFVPTC